jgi:ubiquinone biosynthesis monooxygenase Coq7
MRPSLVYPSWRLAVFTFGLVTAAIGPKAAMACTIAVEEVTGKNYQKQADILGEDELDLHAINERFHDEELKHRDIVVDHDGREAQNYELMRSVIQRDCRTAIKIAEKI